MEHGRTQAWIWSIRSLVALSFLGLCFAHWFDDPPYRAILWDEAMMRPLLSLFGYTWDDWAGSLFVNDGIDQSVWYIGLCFLILSIGSLVPWSSSRAWIFASVCLVSLLVVGVFRWAAHAYDLAWPLEFFLRLSIPLCMWTICQKRPFAIIQDKLLILFLCLCSGTYIGHGLYALGVFPTPLAFRQMISSVLPLQDAGIHTCLYLIGAIDIIVAGLVWWPPARRSILLWMTIWGSLTALMRLSFIDWDFFSDTIMPALAAFLERLPHAFVPFLLWFHIGRRTHFEDQEQQDEVTSP